MYCTPVDVKYIITTALEDHEIEDLITLSDSDLDARLAEASLDANLKKLCSMQLTAATMAGKNPENYTVNNVRIDMGKRVREWRASVQAIIQQAKAGRATVKVSSYRHIDEDVRYPS